MLQHVLGNSLQCGGVSFVTTCLAQKLNWRLLPKTCCSMFRRSQSTDFTCAILQALRILNICKTFDEIHVPLNFLFKFTGINLVQLNINPVLSYDHQFLEARTNANNFFLVKHHEQRVVQIHSKLALKTHTIKLGLKWVFCFL